ncbi:hypothetical protein [Rhizobium sophoriradicis]|uniref:hypothetical protein n=1 Tax=Rhizobium sophoriradicis TaxID=1535245 RepID=UPI001FDF7FEA|nr:hypothetical protein [Rhizobium sophoriradicis]
MPGHARRLRRHCGFGNPDFFQRGFDAYQFHGDCGLIQIKSVECGTVPSLMRGHDGDVRYDGFRPRGLELVYRLGIEGTKMIGKRASNQPLLRREGGEGDLMSDMLV